MDDSVWPDERAGWLRRTLALLIDSLCVMVPSIVLGTVLFAITGGYIQWASPGLQWQICTSIAAVPANLEPPPPANSNEAAVCRTSSLLGPIGFSLTVGRTMRDKGQTQTVSRSYSLRASGQAGGYDVSWITYATLLALLIGGECRSGTTPGKRLLGIRVVAAEDPKRCRLPLSRIAARYGIAIGGVLLPLGLALALILVPVALGETPGKIPFLVFALLLVSASAWQIWNVVRIVRRRPAIYDYIARIEVVRTSADATPVIRTPGPASP